MKVGCYLLDSDGLGEVSGEINIDALEDSKVVREELERDDVDQTLQAVDGLGDTDGLVVLDEAVITAVANDDGLTLAGRDLLERALDLGVERVAGHDKNNGHVLVDQGKGTVLELTSQNTLTVHVRDFLDLERTLEAGRVLVSTAHEEQAALLGKGITSEGLQVDVLGEDFLDMARQAVETINDLLATFRHRHAVLGELDGHHDEGNVLGRVGLGGGDTNLGTGVDVDTAVGLARDGGADGVGDTDTKGTALQTVAHGQDSVGRLTGLGDEDADIVTEDGRAAIQEVRGKLDLSWDLGQFLENGPGLETQDSQRN